MTTNSKKCNIGGVLGITGSPDLMSATQLHNPLPKGEIVATLSQQLNWSHKRGLCSTVA